MPYPNEQTTECMLTTKTRRDALSTPLPPPLSLVSPKLCFSFKVVSIKEFGAFVSLEGTDRQGLLHRSAISNHPIDNVSDVLDVGEKIFVKIISNKDGKLGLSMKVVNQTTGEDRDPNNLINAEMKKRKQGAFRPQSPIRLGAELNTVCKRCGVKGILVTAFYSFFHPLRSFTFLLEVQDRIFHFVILGHLASSCFAQTGAEFLGLVTSGSEEDDEKLPTSASRKSMKKRKGGHSKHHRSSENRKRKERERSRSPLNNAITKVYFSTKNQVTVVTITEGTMNRSLMSRNACLYILCWKINSSLLPLFATSGKLAG
ncbi:unnamed protein product [Taenia asiatica]|uniref:S1 motif domain-containing protein n=1 Tax=Taenia asiatica TaxID=60517 RepID=A0A0R3W7K6_TAEAS|nr:unnamed protein product [Taenia asiatica]